MKYSVFLFVSKFWRDARIQHKRQIYMDAPVFTERWASHQIRQISRCPNCGSLSQHLRRQVAWKWLGTTESGSRANWRPFSIKTRSPVSTNVVAQWKLRQPTTFQMPKFINIKIYPKWRSEQTCSELPETSRSAETPKGYFWYKINTN